MSNRLMQILASLAQRRALRTLNTICETQHQISTRKLGQYLEPIGDELAGHAFHLRIEYDALTSKVAELEAELAKLRAGQEPVAVAVDEQAAFEDWLARVRPSGDAESVHDQWKSSSDYEDLLAAPRQPEGEIKPDITTKHGYPAYSVEQHQRAIAELREECERLRHAPSQELAGRLAAQLLESGAENYQEAHFDLEFEASGVKCVAVVRLQHPDKPSPHELRQQAEAERDTMRQQRDKLAGLLREAEAELEDWRLSFPDANSIDTDQLLERIDAALAEVEMAR